MSSAPIEHDFAPPTPDHPADLYDYDDIAVPLPSLDAIDEAAVKQYREQGYLAVENAYSLERVEAARQALSELIAPDHPSQMKLMFEANARDRLDELSQAERELAVRKLMSFRGADERLDTMLFDAGLRGALETLGCDDPQVFQTMALIKGPGGKEKPWHQDQAYFNSELDHRVLGVWIALDEATPENGCMRVIPRRMSPVHHWSRRDWQICDTDIQAIDDPRVAVPLKPGGLLFFDSLLPHGTPRNMTNQRRRALQFHFLPASARRISQEERLAIFGTEGKDVTC